MFQDRPRVLQEGKVEAPSMPNDKFEPENPRYVYKNAKNPKYQSNEHRSGSAAQGLTQKIYVSKTAGN